MKRLFTVGTGLIALVLFGTSAIDLSPIGHASPVLSDRNVIQNASTLPPDPNWIVSPSDWL